MKRFQIAGQVLFPIFISFISLHIWILIDHSLHSMTNLFMLIFYGGMLYWSLVTFFKRHMLHIHLGFKDLPKEWLILFQFLILAVLTISHSKINPELYIAVTPWTIAIIGVTTSTLTILLTKIVSVHTVFMKITPTLYMDLTYSELHTKEEIHTYRGVKTIIEDLSVENLLLTSEYIGDRKTKDTTIEITELPGKLHIQCFLKGVLQWEDTYSATTFRPENKWEIEDILRKIG